MRAGTPAIVAILLTFGLSEQAGAQSSGLMFPDDAPPRKTMPRTDAVPTGPSFDCSLARAQEEIAICSDEALSKLDRSLSSAFKKASERAGKEAATATGRKLLSSRSECESDVACLKKWHADALRAYSELERGSTKTSTASQTVPTILSGSPSKEQTLAAIKDIYEGQGACSAALGKDSLVWKNWAFSTDDDKIRFYVHETHYFSQISHSMTNGWSLTFNPAEITRFQYVQVGEQKQLKLICIEGDECIYDGVREAKRNSFNIYFCNAEKRERVYRALHHLQTLYVPSARSPF